MGKCGSQPKGGVGLIGRIKKIVAISIRQEAQVKVKIEQAKELEVKKAKDGKLNDEELPLEMISFHY